jgi:hypothetical protein
LGLLGGMVGPGESPEAAIRHGVDLQLFRPEEFAAEARAVAWDLAAVLMHARREILFRPAGAQPAI